MKRVLQLKQRSKSISIVGARQLTRLRIYIPPFLDEKGASVDQEVMLLTRERVGNSRVCLATQGEGESMKNVLHFRSPLHIHREQEFDLEYTSKG